MNYKKLGNTELEVSTICLGTMTWGEQNSEKDGFDQMDYALDKGVNFFDTAELYSIPPKKNTFGKTEEIIGNWFVKRKNREKVILASKISGPGLNWIRGGGNQYDKKNLNLALNESLNWALSANLDGLNCPYGDGKASIYIADIYKNSIKKC